MDDKVYLIGEFAAINKVSARMLRHYDKTGLLNPITIKANGYRYYSEQQIAIISRIKMLRDCDFSLEDISQILMNHNDAFFMKQVHCKIIDLNQQSTLHQRAIALLKGLIEGDNKPNPPNMYGISLTQRTAHTLLVSRQEFDLVQVEPALDHLFALLEKKRFSTNGCVVLLNGFNTDDANKSRIGVPVLSFYQDEHYHTISVPKSARISTIHYGDYYNIGYAYSSIMRYAELNGCPIEPYFVERYLIDSSHTISPQDYVTEVSVALKNTP